MKKKFLAVLVMVAMLLSLTIFASAADTVNITISGDLMKYVKEYFGLIRGPLETALNYFISYLQYLAGWIRLFF